MNEIIKLQREIKKTKQNLINKARKKGLYENFGQREVMNLKDKFINSSKYTNDENAKRNLISTFDNWSMNFDDNDLKRLK